MRRHRNRGRRQDRVDGVDAGVLDADAGEGAPLRSEFDLLTRASAEIGVLSAVIERGQVPQGGVAARRHVVSVVAEPLAVVEQGYRVRGIEPEHAAPPCEVGDDVDGGAVADGACRARRLVDVLVVEYDLRAPCGLAVEVMLPSAGHDVALVVPTQACLLGGLRHRGGREPIREQVDGCASRRGGCCRGAAALEGIGRELVERKPDRQVRRQRVADDLEGETVIRCRRIGHQ